MKGSMPGNGDGIFHPISHAMASAHDSLIIRGSKIVASEISSELDLMLCVTQDMEAGRLHCRHEHGPNLRVARAIRARPFGPEYKKGGGQGICLRCGWCSC